MGTTFGCFGGGGDEGSRGADGGCFDCNSSQASFLHLDTENIAALLSVDQSTIQAGALSTLKNASDAGATESSPVQGIDSQSGEIRDSLRCFSTESNDPFTADGAVGLSTDCWDQVPRIVTVAECGGYVYLVFERPFIFRTVCPDGTRIEDYSDPWSPSSCFTSQVFRSSGPIQNYQAGDRIETSNLVPVLVSLEVNTWDRRRDIQFDGSCNLYLTAHVSGTSNDVLIKILPTASEDQYTEVINANICYQRYLVTSDGDVHYTGRTSSGSDCGGDSFYRMVSSGGVLTEITRGWWDYAFEPYGAGKVVFYGPDPTQSGVPTWDNACLFQFDNSRSGNARYTKLVNCISDWGRYINEGPAAEFSNSSNDTSRERCTQQFYTLRGNNQPDQILTIDRNGDGTDEVCVVADTEYKKTGTWKCDICIDNGTAHCKNAQGMITGDTTQQTCTAAGGTWLTAAECFNEVTTSACTISQPAGWNLNHSWCQDPGSSWSQTYAALACIQSDKSVELISASGETVTNAWVVGNRIVYSSVQDGIYHMKGVSFSRNGTASVSDLVSGIEMYEVAVDPTEGVDRLLVNGLRFSDNSYVFGRYNFTSGQLKVDTGLTGLVDTMLIIGD